ncbi:MAG: iron-sulfur cluster assembly protein, partial [Candidatus Latescibacterota bacterium]
MNKKIFFIVLLVLFTWGASGNAQTNIITEEGVWNELKNLQDGYLGTPLSVVDMGLIYSVKVENNNVRVVITTYHEGFVDVMKIASPVRKKILAMSGVGTVTVELLWPPPWTPDRLSKKARDVLGFFPGDPVEGGVHVRSAFFKSAPDAKPYDEMKLDRSHLVIPETVWGVVDTLPGGRLLNWRGWQYFKRFEVEERDGLARMGEPIFVDVSFAGEQVNDLAKEIRVIEETSEKEIPCQVYGSVQEGNIKKCTVVLLSDMAAKEKKSYLLIYGNFSPDLPIPSYTTDLVTRGEGFALDIENSYYKANLSPRMGQLKNLQFKRNGITKKTIGYPTSAFPPPTIINATNDPGNYALDLVWHGEDPCMHWGPDIRNRLRFRITMWPKVPNYTVEKGPICTIIKRWGYPVVPMYPAMPQTDVTIEVTYVFYSSLPYFTMESRIKVEKEFDMTIVRNAQWDFGGFTNMISMIDGGAIVVHQKQSGNVPLDKNQAIMGCYNSGDGYGFAALHLSYD